MAARKQISLSAINSGYSINVNLYVSKTDLEGGTDDIGLAGTHTTLNIVESEWVDLDPKFSAAKNNPYELSIYSPSDQRLRSGYNRFAGWKYGYSRQSAHL